jgi:DNA-binding beta-propeller fold protein YncE
VNVGNGAFSIALAPAHNTLYVPDTDNGDGPRTLSMIDTTHCNGDDSSGCATQPSATTLTGRAPLTDAVDPSTGTLYVTNFGDASVFTYNTATCNA